MCQVLLRVVDKTNLDDPYHDCKCLKRGDIVVVVGDAHVWGREELRDPAWRILRLPNITVEQAEAFLGPELDTDPANPSRVLQRRQFKLDVDNVQMPAGLKAWLLDFTRAQPTRSINWTWAQIEPYRARKAPRQDPNVFEPLVELNVGIKVG